MKKGSYVTHGYQLCSIGLKALHLIANTCYSEYILFYFLDTTTMAQQAINTMYAHLHIYYEYNYTWVQPQILSLRSWVELMGFQYWVKMSSHFVTFNIKLILCDPGHSILCQTAARNRWMKEHFKFWKLLHFFIANTSQLVYHHKPIFCTEETTCAHLNSMYYKNERDVRKCIDI